MTFAILLPVGWLCHFLYLYQLYFFEHYSDPKHLFDFHHDLLLNIPRDTCLEEKCTFGSVWLIPVLEHLTVLLEILQELTHKYRALSTFLSMHLNSSIITCL